MRPDDEALVQIPCAVTADACVLIVDDDEDAGDILGLALQCYGHDVVIARSGIEALEHATASTPPGAALIDLALPVMDGFEVARRMRATHPATVLVALTGFSDENSRRAAEQAGFDRYVVKPISARDLDELLCAALRANR